MKSQVPRLHGDAHVLVDGSIQLAVVLRKDRHTFTLGTPNGRDGDTEEWTTLNRDAAECTELGDVWWVREHKAWVSVWWKPLEQIQRDQRERKSREADRKLREETDQWRQDHERRQQHERDLFDEMLDLLDPRRKSLRFFGLDPSATVAALDAAYRSRAIREHPDRGGDPAAFKQTQEQYEQARCLLTK